MNTVIRKKILSGCINALWVFCLLFIGWFVIQLVFFASFKIPSSSMEPILKKGDHILVWKGIPGARLFNFIDLSKGNPIKIYRLPRIRDVRRNDVLVFNNPYPSSPDKIEMDLMKYYVKRCLGLPGDTVLIQKKAYILNGIPYDTKYNAYLPDLNEIFINEYNNEPNQTFPYDSVIKWNTENFGPLYIPRKGDILTMNRTNYLLYHKIIEWEQKTEVIYSDSLTYLNQLPFSTYTFEKDYFFMMSDHGEYSCDSRYWGLLPEDFIVGKVWLIWKSTEPYFGKWRWERVCKKVI